MGEDRPREAQSSSRKDHHLSRHEPAAVAGAIHPIVEDWPRFRGVAHRHGLGEIIYAIEGVVSVATDEGTWVVPPDRAVWIPVGVEHTTRSHGPVRFRALFVSPQAEESFPLRPCVVEVSALLREAIRRFTELSEGERETDFAGCLTQLILAELRFTALPSLELPRPRDPRLIALCDVFVEAPAQEIPLEVAAARCGVSRAGFMRLFRAETGTSWGRWCRHARLFAGLTRLAEGQSVLAAALDCGYQSPSAFASAFRATLGRTPREWFGARG